MTIFPAFVAAIARGDDDETEALAQRLTPVDEPDLLTLAAGTDAEERWWAVRGLAVAGGAAAAPVVQAALAAPRPDLRAAAALALVQLHERAPSAVTPALDAVAALLSDDDGLVRQAAADCLAQCGDDAVPALGRILRESTHQGARTRAASALRKIATMKAAALLYPLLNDPNHLVRMYAYEGLDEMGLLENVLVVL